MDFNVIFGRGFGFICVFSCTNFSGTSLRFDLAASASCNKHQGLHLQCGYRLVRWDSNWCFQFANRVWDFCCNQFCNRLLGRHCFVVIYHLLVLSVNPKKTLQPKSCYRYSRLQKTRGTKHKTLQDNLFCDRRVHCFLGTKHDIVHHQNFSTKFVSKVCYFHFIYVACDKFSCKSNDL